ncbi:MAG TPA: glycosyltransferase [Candidatus Binataceae bacterium]|nr:glycosyltransferase [Candidatus Binataceae bacterium]
MNLSVIIATRDRPESLARLIRSLAPQLRSGAHEIIVAENGSAQPTALPTDLPPLRHLHEPRSGKCRIQNRAITEAAGAILIFLDDDLIAGDDYLAAVEQFFAQHPRFAAMAGRVVAMEDPATKLGAQWVYLDLPIFDRGDKVVEVPGVIGANMAFRAAAIARVGRFDERLGPGAAGHEEETEMSARLGRAGFSIGYAPAAIVYHEVDPARADRERFIRVSRERGRCRMLHEKHSAFEVLGKNAIAWIRLRAARFAGASAERIAREERRAAVAHGMFDGLAGSQPAKARA